MKFVLIFLLLFNSFMISQNIEIEWAKTWEGASEICGIDAVPGYGIYFCGSFQNTLLLDDIELSSPDMFSGFFAFADCEGNVSEGFSIYGQYFDTCREILWDVNGNYYVIGEFSSNWISICGDTLVNIWQAETIDLSTSDVFVLKFDGANNLLWSRSFGGIHREFVWAAGLNMNGDLYICGNMYSESMEFGDHLLENSGNIDIYIVKYDSYGNEEWGISPEGDNQENIWDLVMDTGGNIYCCGSYNGSAISFDEQELINTSDDFDFYIAKLAPNGQLIWLKSGRGGGWDDITALSISDDGFLYAAGFFDSPSLSIGDVTINDTDPVYYSQLLLKYNLDGIILDGASTTGNSNVSPNTIDISNSMAYVSGSYIGPFVDFGEVVLGQSDTYDSYLATYDNNLLNIDAIAISGDGMEFPECVSIDLYGGVYMGGKYNGTGITIGNEWLPNNYYPTGSQFYITKVSCINTAGSYYKIAQKENLFSVYPNPFNASLSIDISDADNDIEICIYNVQGRLIRNLGSSGSWDAKNDAGSPVASGVYNILARSGNKFQTRKIVFLK